MTCFVTFENTCIQIQQLLQAEFSMLKEVQDDAGQTVCTEV